MTAPGTPSTPGQGGVIIDGPGLYATADGREVEVTALHGECWRGHLGRNLGWWYEASGEVALLPKHPDRIVRKLPPPTPAPSPAAEVDAIAAVVEYLRGAQARAANAAATPGEGRAAAYGMLRAAIDNAIDRLARATRTEGGAS